ncbi:hypothetical protein ACFVFS_18875 [Kitasatospora sp. NPDC057692]|uniref:hypothetical protein n=1 Tax=Kitasatospora sp. NPDC057692 TaxID=3346215 RepID=UPI00368B13DA
MRSRVFSLLSAVPVAAALTLLGAAVPAQASSPEPAEAAPAAAAPSPAKATGTFMLSYQGCSWWGCDYVPYFSVDNPEGCHALPPAPAGELITNWTEWYNGTDQQAYLYKNGTCEGQPDAVLDQKSTIEFQDAPYHSVLFRQG